MIWLRKGIVHLLALVLLISLWGGVASISAKQTFGEPEKLKTTLRDSGVYKGIVDSALVQAQQDNASNGGQSEGIDLSDPDVKKAAEKALSPQVLEKNVEAFLDANYAWLEGKTDKPAFKVDLTDAKEAFISEVAKTAGERVDALAPCTAVQLANIPDFENVDLLKLPCQPPGLTPQLVEAQVTRELSVGDFLKEPVITQDTLQAAPGSETSIDTTAENQPYYTKLDDAPKFYQLGQKLPWIFAALAVLSTLGIIFIAITKRRGVRRVGWVFAVAGILLIIAKFSTDFLFNWLEKAIKDSEDIGKVKEPLIDVVQTLKDQFLAFNLYFGIGFVLIALIIFLILRKTRPVKDNIDDAGPPVIPPPRPEHITDDIKPLEPLSPQPKPGAPGVPRGQAPSTRPRKKPRLIQ